MSGDDSQPKKKDVILVGGPTGNADGLAVLRAREGALEVGELRTPKDGEAIQGDLVRLKQRAEHERLFDVESVLSQEQHGTTRSGPPQVASDNYRQNWEAVFASSRKREFLN